MDFYTRSENYFNRKYKQFTIDDKIKFLEKLLNRLINPDLNKDLKEEEIMKLYNCRRILHIYKGLDDLNWLLENKGTNFDYDFL